MKSLSVLLGLIGTTIAQGQGGQGGGNLVNVNNCTSSCDLEACDDDSDCATVWERFANNKFIDLDNFLNVFEDYCNTTGENATYTCGTDEVNDLYDCIIYSDCWDTIKTTYSPNCTTYSEFSFSFTVYSSDGTYSATQMCNQNWNTYVTNIFGDDAIIRVTTEDCDDTDSDSESEGEGESESSEGEGEGGAGNDRRLLQEAEGEGEGESESESEGEGEDSSSGNGACDDVTYSGTISYISDYTGTENDLADKYLSLKSELTAQTSLTDLDFYIGCYSNACCEHIDSADSQCVEYTSGSCTTVDYTCTATVGQDDDAANSIVITTLIAFVTVMGFLFGN